MIESMTWQEWITAYFVLGAVVITGLYSCRVSKKPTFANQLAAVIEKQLDERKPRTQRVLERQVMPGLALLVGWIFWPLMLVGRFRFFFQQDRKAPTDGGLLQGNPLHADDPSASARQRDSDDLYVSPHERAILAEEGVMCLSVIEIEKANRVEDPLGAVPTVPFGHLNPVWLHLNARQKAGGGEFWSFRCERVGVEKEFLAFSGYALFDGETYVDHFVVDHELAK